MFNNFRSYRKVGKTANGILIDYLLNQILQIFVANVEFLFELFIRTHHQVLHILTEPVFVYEITVTPYPIIVEINYNFISVTWSFNIFNFVVIFFNGRQTEAPVAVLVFLNSSSQLLDLHYLLKLLRNLIDLER